MPNVFDEVHAENKKAAGNVFDQIHSETQGAGAQVKEGISHFLSGINPLEIAGHAKDAAYQAVVHPVETGKAILGQQGAVGEKAIESFKKGDYLEGVRHAIGYLLPVVGPQIDKMGNDAQAGNVGAALGDAAAFGATNALPGSKLGDAIAAKATVPVKALFRNPNPVTKAAVDFATANDIPVSAATATGNKFIQGAQAVLDQSPAGSIIASGAKAREATALTRVGNELADRVHPAPVSPEGAGLATGGDVEGVISKLRKEAEQDYGNFRGAVNDPKHLESVQVGTKPGVPNWTPSLGNHTPNVPVMEEMQMPVDIRGIKPAAKAQLDEMSWMPAAEKASSAGYTALKKLVEGPDFIPVLQAEKGLGGLKSLAREAASPDLRNASQGIGAHLSDELQQLIDSKIASRDPAALRDLQAGRATHAAKMEAADVLQKMRDEPVQLFKQATWAGDSGINQLRDVAKLAPGAMPKIGRAYIEKMLDTATAEGGFARADKLASDWKALGPETKKILFKDPALISDLDKFWLIAKKSAENPNPSGSALVGTIAAGVGYTLKNPITGIALNIPAASVSAMLHSPSGVRALTEGLKIPIGAKVMAVGSYNRILKAAGSLALPAPSAQP